MGVARLRRLSGQALMAAMKSETRYWHYTAVLEKIIASGEIRTTSVGRAPTVKAAVWLSTNPNWERTVRKRLYIPGSGHSGKLVSRDGLLKAGFQPARIEVSPELPFITWQEYRNLSGDSAKELNAMEWIARDWGADPQEWRVLFNSISATSGG